MQKQCKNCEEIFIAKDHRKIFCSHRCSAIISNKNRAKPPKIIHCRMCQKKHIPSPSSIGIYCSVQCQKNYENTILISRWKAGEDPGWSGKTRLLKNFVRNYLLEKYNFACVRPDCGWNKRHPIDNRPLVEVNHIDGNAENCQEENLEVICPNCHSETSNFRARNTGSKRMR